MRSNDTVINFRHSKLTYGAFSVYFVSSFLWVFIQQLVSNGMTIHSGSCRNRAPSGLEKGVRYWTWKIHSLYRS